MKTTLSILLLTAILLSGFLTSITPVREAKAAGSVGKVCIADPTTANNGLSLNPKNVCPSSPTTFNGPWTNASSPVPPQPSPTQIRVGVYVNDSDPMSVFEVTLIANHNILTPIDANFTGTVLVGPQSAVIKCIAGVLKIGTTCDPARDTVDTITFEVTGALGSFTPIHTTGLLFTAIYNITGHTPSTGILVDFQTGCTNSSVPGGVCILIGNGSTSLVPETAQNGQFNNNTPPPFISISTNQTLIGPRTPPYSHNVTITATSQNGWPGFSTDAVTFTTAVSPGLATSIKGTNPCAAGSTSCSVTVTITVTRAGAVTILGTYASVDPATTDTSTLVAPVTVSAVIPDFTINANPLTVGPIIPTVTGTSTITVVPIYGFNGDVTLTTNAVSSGLTATLSPGTITGASGTSTLTVSANTVGNYSLSVIGTSGPLSHITKTINVTVNVSTSLTVTLVSVSPTTGSVGTKITFTIVVNNTGPIPQLASLNALVGNVTVQAQNVTFSVGPNTKQLTWDTTGFAPGTYTLGAKIVLLSGGKNNGNGMLTPVSFTLTAASGGSVLDVLSQNLPITLGAIAVAVVTVLGIFLILRRNKGKTPSAL